MLNICWQSYHLCLKILAVVSRFWNSYINFIFYLIQSWTKIVGTLVHNSVVFRYSISILPSPPFNVVLLWTRRANFIAYHVWLQHWFRGVGSVKCPSINGQDCRCWADEGTQAITLCLFLKRQRLYKCQQNIGCNSSNNIYRTAAISKLLSDHKFTTLAQISKIVFQELTYSNKVN